MDILLRNYSSTNLKIRLAFLYSLSVFIILVSSGVAIFYSNENFRKEEFSKKLTAEAAKCATIVLTSPYLSSRVYDTLNDNALHALNDGSIFVYDMSQRLVYKSPGSLFLDIPAQSFDEARYKKPVYMSNGAAETVVAYAAQKGRAYYIVVSATDVAGNQRSNNLAMLLASAVLGGILLSGFLAFLYVRQAMRPLDELKREIEKIDESNLKKRVTLNTSNDEVSQIGQKFNAMLDRIEQAFEQRKNFVHHASHELRTPLANMLSQTEAALNTPLSEDEYRRILHSLKEDQQDMIDLTNSLLALSRYEKITIVGDWIDLRIDEILYQCVDFINQVWPSALIAVNFDSVPEDENMLVFKGNEALVKSAIQNLLKNAVQYSTDQKVEVVIAATSEGIRLQFDNHGIQLNPEEQSRLFIPFFRGENAGSKKGHGLGLSIVQRIVNVHRGTITYAAVDSETNRFTIFFPCSK